MGIVKKNTLNRFLQRLDTKKRVYDAEAVSNIVADIGVETAQEQYDKGSYTPDSIKSYIVGNQVEIRASGERIAYAEYGTGQIGKGTYKGTLPTQTLTFESPKGSLQTTHGWEYYYPNTKTKVNGGWYIGKKFTRGEKATAQMFKTAQDLKRTLPSKVRTEIEKEK